MTPTNTDSSIISRNSSAPKDDKLSFSFNFSPDVSTRKKRNPGQVSQESIDDLNAKPIPASRSGWFGRSVQYGLCYATYLAGQALATPLIGPTGGFYAGLVTGGAVKLGGDYLCYEAFTKPAIKEIVEVNNYNNQLIDQANRQKKSSSNNDNPEMDNLEKLPGLKKIKGKIIDIATKVKIDQTRKELGLKVHLNSYHMLFIGSSGTGKTESAKALAKILYNNGAIRENKCILADKSDFISYYVGDTAAKTEKVFNKASGGILFVDEAYQFNNNESSTTQHNITSDAIAKILTLLEERKDDVIVIFSGYPKEMQTFKELNLGLASRIPITVNFDDFTETELANIFKFFCDKSDYSISEPVYNHARELISRLKSTHGESFANARTVRNFFERVIEAQATRLSSEPTETDPDQKDTEKDKLTEKFKAILINDLDAVALEQLNPNEKAQPLSYFA